MSTILQTTKTPCSAKTVLNNQFNFKLSEIEFTKKSPCANGFHDIPQTHDDASLFVPKLKSFTKQLMLLFWKKSGKEKDFAV